MAGPLVAAAVCLPLDDIDTLLKTLKGVKDSKKMTRLQREKAYRTSFKKQHLHGVSEKSLPLKCPQLVT